MTTTSMRLNGQGVPFPIEISRDAKTNLPVAAYIRVKDGKVADTRDLAEGVIFADYDSAERLLGIELLAPCKREFLCGLPKPESELLQQFMESGTWSREESVKNKYDPVQIAAETRVHQVEEDAS